MSRSKPSERREITSSLCEDLFSVQYTEKRVGEPYGDKVC